MTSDEELDFSDICRVCCLRGTLLSLFKVHLNRKLMACTNVTVWKDDNLPAQICSKCVSKLHIAFQFKKLCEKSDARLRNHLEKVLADREKKSQETAATTVQVQQQVAQMQSVIPIQNNFVYITECNPSIPVMQDIKQFSNEVTSLVPNQVIQSNALAYNLNSMGVLNGLATNGYALQNLSVPPAAVQYQTFSVPLLNQPNGLVQPITVSAIPLQPIVSQVDINEPNKDDVRLNDGVNSAPNISNINEERKNDSKTCSTCGKVFPTLLKLSRHTKTHSQTFTHRCKICHKGFTHGGNFKVHMRMHNDERPFSCPICNYTCRQLQDLQKHKRKHNGERPYICKYCSKGFSTSSNLISHERIHTFTKPYVCSICQKAFCQSNELTKHYRTHTHEKSHTCKVCKKGFNGSSTLIVHMRTHSGERPHICQYCHKGFTQSSCLKVHLKRHKDNEDNFQCDQCPRKFISSSSLKEHIGSHTEGDSFTQSSCLPKFIICNSHMNHNYLGSKVTREESVNEKASDNFLFQRRHRNQ
ncbi:Histone-lysine N-methyltransferase PRDM9 [Pseudolycoriella hygida]|uniref:Histone-lysine N-methyltransferase PRDM9 n=1 Tax=Pseudolycoriella hygida TaxID=35572 RepID=A0A9Q0NCY4_9DIPT|nr:Histone-lysine N-methyltransferase PRDM9 [Pseudolycoriella hygida]